MTIRRIIVFSGLLLVLLSATLIISLMGLNRSENTINDAWRRQLVSLSLADELKESSRSLTAAIQNFVVTGDTRYAEEYMTIIDIRSGVSPRPDDREVAPGLSVSLEELMREADYTQSELVLLRRSALLSERLVSLELEAMNTALGLYLDGNGNYTVKGVPDRQKAIELIFSESYQEQVDTIMEPFTDFKRELESRLNATVDKAQAGHLRSLITVWSVLFVVLAMYFFLLFLLNRVIVRPIIECDAFAKEISEGNMDSRLTYYGKNEIGSLAASLRRMLESLLDRVSLVEHMRFTSAAISAVDDGVVIRDKNGVILNWNNGAEMILGYQAPDIIGRFTNDYTPQEAQGLAAVVDKCLENGEHIAHMDIVRRRKDGQLIDCSASYTPIFDDNGEYTGSVAIFHDVTEKRQMERRLEAALLKAEEASKTKSTFLAVMSHEIRTPMNGVIGFAELALGDTNLSGETRDNIQKIKASADTLLDIINNILDISKIEAGAMELESIPFSLHDIFRGCETICGPKAAEKNISLHFYSEPFLNKKLIGDPAKLRQALLNLLSNAIKFTNYGMVKTTALLEEEGEDYVKFRFEVKDSGIGMTEEQMARIFDPFVQADSSTTRKYGGTGLGLSITKSFLEMMGSELIVRSVPGLGSKFKFSMTFKTVSESAVTQHTKESEEMKKPWFTGDVLVCEDNATNQEVIKQHLIKLGLNPVIAGNGKLGVKAAYDKMAKGESFALIMMDIHMPVMDGLEAAEHLLAMGVKTPIVALTANAMLSDKENYLKIGMSDYLSKPYTAQELWTCLLRHLTPVDTVPVTGENEMKSANSLIVNDILNEEEGIKHGTGDEEFYRHLQRNFIKDNSDVIEKINEALNSGDFITAHRTAHSLKSAARTIGAGKLAQAAAEVEHALLDGKPDYESIAMLKQAAAELFAVMPPVTDDEAPTGDAALQLNEEEAANLLEKLLPLLKALNPECLNYLDDAKTVLSGFGQKCAELAEQMENYDFPEAYETAAEISAALGLRR